MDDLKLLRDIIKKYNLLKDEKTIAHRNWSAWNAWAYDQPWYPLWASENGFKMSDLRSRHKDPTARVIYEEDEGAALYAIRSLIEHELEILRHERSQCLKRLWERQTQGKWTYSLIDIAEAYGQNPVAVNTMLLKQPWYRRRVDMNGHRWDKKSVI